MDDIMKGNFDLVEIDGKLALFTNLRLPRKDIPEGLFCYDVRDSDDLDGTFAEIAPYVMVNHWGTIICKEEITLDEYNSYYPENDAEFIGVSISVEVFKSNTTEQLRAMRT